MRLAVTTRNTGANPRRFIKAVNKFAYPAFKRRKKGSVFRYNQFGFSLFFNSNALSIGERVKATKADTSTEPDTTIANSLNNCPLMPPIKIIGINTAARVMVVEITAK
ncbi:hypothetical protein D3C87_1703650 [compost metagenome]